jgi:pimeloyl-ACP methyl ester carboxylesterase
LPVTLEQHAEDLERLRAVLGFERLVPIGSAVSTMIAACYAALHPASTQALILASATARSSPAACEMLIARAAAVRADGLAAILPQAVERAFLNQPHDERYRHYYEAFARQLPDDYALACQAAAHYDAEPYLTQVRCPSLVVSSAHDVLLPPALGRDVARLIPGAEFQVMPDAAHFAPYQVPEAFASLVLRFLDAAAVAPTARSG